MITIKAVTAPPKTPKDNRPYRMGLSFPANSDIAKNYDVIREDLRVKLGQEVSFTFAIAYLAKFYLQHRHIVGAK